MQASALRASHQAQHAEWLWGQQQLQAHLNGAFARSHWPAVERQPLLQLPGSVCHHFLRPNGRYVDYSAHPGQRTTVPARGRGLVGNLHLQIGHSVRMSLWKGGRRLGQRKQHNTGSILMRVQNFCCGLASSEGPEMAWPAHDNSASLAQTVTHSFTAW